MTVFIGLSHHAKHNADKIIREGDLNILTFESQPLEIQQKEIEHNFNTFKPN